MKKLLLLLLLITSTAQAQQRSEIEIFAPSGGTGTSTANTWTAEQTFNSAIHINASSNVGPAAALYFGGLAGVYPYIYYNSFQTPDTLNFGTGSTANSILVTEAADAGFDFAHAAQTNPTIFIHSANQSTTEWSSFSFDTIATGSGILQFNTAIQMTEQTAPAAPSANQVRVYSKDNGAGKTQLCALFNTGAEQCFATEP